MLVVTALGVANLQGKEFLWVFPYGRTGKYALRSKKAGNLSSFLKNWTRQKPSFWMNMVMNLLDRTGSQLFRNHFGLLWAWRSIILNTNLEFSRWVNVLYDEQMTAATLDTSVTRRYTQVPATGWRNPASMTSTDPYRRVQPISYPLACNPGSRLREENPDLKNYGKCKVQHSVFLSW